MLLIAVALPFNTQFHAGNHNQACMRRGHDNAQVLVVVGISLHRIFWIGMCPRLAFLIVDGSGIQDFLDFMVVDMPAIHAAAGVFGKFQTGMPVKRIFGNGGRGWINGFDGQHLRGRIGMTGSQYRPGKEDPGKKGDKGLQAATHLGTKIRPELVQPGMYLCAPMTGSRTVAFHTLGCKLNYAETASLSRLFEKEGFEKKDFTDRADIYVINTCSVTDNADKECRHLVRRIQRKSPESFIVITGCYAQLKPREIADIPGVDLVLGAAEKFNITNHVRTLTKGDPARICSCDIEEVKTFHPAHAAGDRTRAFLKVQDGCNYNCSFCTIPKARGKSRSDSIANVQERVRQLADAGIRETVLTGVNLGDFNDPSPAGKNESGFHALCLALDEMTEMSRFRISSIEPNLLTNEIIELVANSDRFMPHFHIPLQSGSNRILKLMRRRYLREIYEDRIRRIRTLIPHCSIGADVIVGFPRESEEDFRDTVEFIERLDLSYLHVFTYSERDDTAALAIRPVVPVAVRNERNKILRNLSYQKLQSFTERFTGSSRKVLFEKGHDGMMEGYTDNYIKVTASFHPEWVNRIVDWRL
jgi:threonylcarbamoyladenosine tRNA methylthiotransferase MtaB